MADVISGQIIKKRNEKNETNNHYTVTALLFNERPT
jgi:hypothetical protein